MKLNNQQIEQAAAKTDHRAMLCQPYLDTGPEGDRIVATDGRILAVVPVSPGADSSPMDDQGYLSIDALKAGRKAGALECNGTLQVPGGASFPRSDLGTFPDYRRIIPKHDSKPDIRLDAELIIRLAKALCDVKGTKPKLLDLYFAKNDDGSVDHTTAVYVEPVNSEGFGVIMPCKIKS